MQPGACFCFLDDMTAESFRAAIEEHVNPGGEIWTDGHGSYEWVDSDPRGRIGSVCVRRHSLRGLAQAARDIAHMRRRDCSRASG